MNIKKFIFFSAVIYFICFEFAVAPKAKKRTTKKPPNNDNNDNTNNKRPTPKSESEKDEKFENREADDKTVEKVEKNADKRKFNGKIT